ncbi:MAG: Dihydrolipoyl dehydrogenase, partial [Campylobacterota bacterium]|nr:Dihydrolipoyl dehydrogenase [Campylobacterota bacterium]
MKNYDVVVIGAGPAGYEAALELAKGGFKTLLVDKNKEKIGGTCLNEGCVPAKNYLQSAEFISKSSYFKECGLDVDIKSFDLGRLREKTLLLKNELHSGVFWLLEQAGVELLYGNASFVDANTIDISGEKITFKRAIIATGSKPKNLAELPLDNKNIIPSSGVFELTSLPSSIAIIGGGAIACEFATFFSSFGAKVTLIVRGSQLLSKEDEDISKTLLRAFKKQNITVLTSAVVQEAEVKNGEVELFIKEIKEPIRCKMVLCASGRTPFTDELNHQKAGVESDERGYIKVSKSYVA